MRHAGGNKSLGADLREPCKIQKDKALAEKTQQQVDFRKTFREKVSKFKKNIASCNSNFRKVADDLKMKKTKKLKIEEICRNLSRAPESAPSLKTQVDKDNNHIPNPAQRIVSKS